jgi:hypothetical protein
MASLTPDYLDRLEMMAREDRFAYWKDTLLLVAEVRRLKRGDFTPEEFQELCHNLHERPGGCTRDVFAAGCREYQEKLFGKEAGIGSPANYALEMVSILERRGWGLLCDEGRWYAVKYDDTIHPRDSMENVISGAYAGHGNPVTAVLAAERFLLTGERP